MREDLKQYLEYVDNTGGNGDIARFDDDWEPIGPMVRQELMPVYIQENEDGKLFVTEAGRKALNETQA